MVACEYGPTAAGAFGAVMQRFDMIINTCDLRRESGHWKVAQETFPVKPRTMRLRGQNPERIIRGKDLSSLLFTARGSNYLGSFPVFAIERERQCSFVFFCFARVQVETFCNEKLGEFGLAVFRGGVEQGVFGVR